MPQIKFPQLITASLLTLPIAFATFTPSAQADVIIRGDQFGVRLGNKSRYRRRTRRFFNQYRRDSRDSRSRWRNLRHTSRRLRRFGQRYRQPTVIYESPDIIYRRTEVITPNRRGRILLEDPAYIMPNRTTIRPARGRYYRNRRFPTYAPGKYLIPLRKSTPRPFGY